MIQVLLKNKLTIEFAPLTFLIERQLDRVYRQQCKFVDYRPRDGLSFAAMVDLAYPRHDGEHGSLDGVRLFNHSAPGYQHIVTTRGPDRTGIGFHMVATFKDGLLHNWEPENSPPWPAVVLWDRTTPCFVGGSLTFRAGKACDRPDGRPSLLSDGLVLLRHLSKMDLSCVLLLKQYQEDHSWNAKFEKCSAYVFRPQDMKEAVFPPDFARDIAWIHHETHAQLGLIASTSFEQLNVKLSKNLTPWDDLNKPELPPVIWGHHGPTFFKNPDKFGDEMIWRDSMAHLTPQEDL